VKKRQGRGSVAREKVYKADYENMINNLAEKKNQEHLPPITFHDFIMDLFKNPKQHLHPKRTSPNKRKTPAKTKAVSDRQQ
jgi:hypothetical protein